MIELTTCPQCGRPIGDHDTFCASCGGMVTPLPSKTIAGVKLNDGDSLLLDKLTESTVGEYEVRGLLGRGGMASVFVAYDLALNRKVALKVMHPGLLGDSGMRERFRLEARLAARLDHSNIVTVHSVKERGNIVFFDLKLIDGTSLDRLIRNRSTPFPPRLARWIIAKISDALNYAHSEGVVHRDMKPANVMVERRGDCVVTDFGIAKAAESPHLTMTGSVVGTPAYMSPEQCLGNDVTAQSDQYSLGILAYEMLTGAVPFSGSMLNIQLGHVERVPPAPNTVFTNIPQSTSDIVMRMIAKEPADRWPTLADAADALLEGLGATDAQMKRELATMVAELPADDRPSLPATPMSPTPVTMLPGEFTQDVITEPLPVRVREAATELMPMTPARATPVIPHEALTPQSTAAIVPERKKRLKLFAIAGGAVAVVVVAVALSSGKAKVPIVAPVLPDSSTAANQDSSLNSALDVSDTVITRVGVDPINATLRLGDSLHLKATAYAAAGDAVAKKVQWSSSDSTLVLIDAEGWIHAIGKSGASPVFVTATAGKRSGVATVNVR